MNELDEGRKTRDRENESSRQGVKKERAEVGRVEDRRESERGKDREREE